MADYEVIGEAVQDAQKLIQHRPDIPNLLSSDMIPVESAETTAASPFDLTGLMQGADTQIILAALCSCIVVFTLVLTGFVRYRERIRRYVTGENRRVGSVYYVRPGMAATQPTEI